MSPGFPPRRNLSLTYKVFAVPARMVPNLRRAAALIYFTVPGIRLPVANFAYFLPRGGDKLPLFAANTAWSTE